MTEILGARSRRLFRKLPKSLNKRESNRTVTVLAVDTVFKTKFQNYPGAVVKSIFLPGA